MPKFHNPLSVLGTYSLVAVAVLVIVVWAWWIVIGGPAHDRRKAAEATAGAVVATGQVKAAEDAAAVTGNQAEKEIDRAELDARNEAAIRSGELDPRVAVCLRDSARRQPACVELLKSRP